METQVTRRHARAADPLEPLMERAANVSRPRGEASKRATVYRSHALRPEEFHDIVAKGRRR